MQWWVSPSLPCPLLSSHGCVTVTTQTVLHRIFESSIREIKENLPLSQALDVKYYMPKALQLFLQKVQFESANYKNLEIFWSRSYLPSQKHPHNGLQVAFWKQFLLMATEKPQSPPMGACLGPASWMLVICRAGPRRYPSHSLSSHRGLFPWLRMSARCYNVETGFRKGCPVEKIFS